MAYTYYDTISAKYYGATRRASAIKYIVVHYTGNKTDTAKANANYFATTTTKASSHYVVDDDSVYQCVPDLKVAYAVGGSKYSDCDSTGGGTMYGVITNSNSISIEMCSTGGAISSATQDNAATLIKSLINKYGLSTSKVYRHLDVNGKHCPGWGGWYGDDTSKWTAFKARLSTTSTSATSTTSTTSTSTTSTSATSTSATSTSSTSSTAISVDGQWGTATTKRMQTVLETTVDGIVSNQLTSCKKYLAAVLASSWEFESSKTGGSKMIKALQTKIGATADGYAGQATVKALQTYLNKASSAGLTVDGYMGAKTVKAVQTWLNAQ